MQRIPITPRADFAARAQELGFAFHTIDGKPYWNESAAYRFTAAEVDTLEDATAELERICLAAVEEVISQGYYDRFGIGPEGAKLIDASWQRGDKNLYGRFDLLYRPGEPPRMLEYNADTPTALFEASVVQWEWLQALYPKADQFNSIHEKLIQAWAHFQLAAPRVHFTCVRDHDEDRGTTDYLRDTAIQAGLDTRFLFIDEIGWDGAIFRDLEEEPIRALFKLYPWEWLLREPFAANIAPSRVQMIEPAWKMILSNKAILALLWHLFPDHPNLLPAALSRDEIQGAVVKKPLLGREGANIAILKEGQPDRPSAATDGPYGAEGFVYQAYLPPPVFDGRYPVLGSWVIASEPAGIGIREDANPITSNLSQFVPHLFE